ncbi:hypothetical protein [Nocardioides terrisoli]|uniref:hypothetical protein n=1 Tax=Nocardioides terrisoli TaxID=3388267 RepID=UPI00287BB267|nr:hypothetical protein [Nocardioides marmorisolisilvae]
MNENYPLGGTLAFTADDEADLSFTPAPITKSDALGIAMDFCEASEPEREALLADLGPVMLKRSLVMLSNVAHGAGDHDAARYALDLRDRITTTSETKAAS